MPIGIVAFLTATRTVRESVSEEERRLDIPGLALGTAAPFSLTYGLIEANHKGWGDPLIVSTLVAGALLIVTFLYWELHSHAAAARLLPVPGGDPVPADDPHDRGQRSSGREVRLEARIARAHDVSAIRPG